MIIVISRPGDVHAQYIIKLLREKGGDVATFDYGLFLNKTSISFTCSNNGYETVIDLGNGIMINSKSVTSVYNRRRRELRLRHQVSSKPIRDYVIREAEQFLEALPQILPCHWLSHPDAIRIADRKPHQLDVASKVGFQIPETLITCSSQQAKKFIKEIPTHIAVKTLRAPSLVFRDAKRKQRAISFFTHKLTHSQALDHIGMVDNCPMIFQEYIEKDFELRVTVVDENVFACAIYSQTSDLTREDFRRYDFDNNRYEPFKLPSDIHEKCLSLIKRFGLEFGCIDIAVTPAGNYVFLEINPNGQWLGFENRTGLRIADAIVSNLMNNKPLG